MYAEVVRLTDNDAASPSSRGSTRKKGKRMLTQTAVTYKVLSGPSREELFDSLRLYDEHREVEFVMRSPEKVKYKAKFQMISLEAEDGSGQSWIFSCVSSFDRSKYSGWYNSRTRAGHLTRS